MLTSEAMGKLAAEMTDAQTQGDAESLAAIAWQLYGEVGEDLAEIGRLRAAIHAAWSQPQGNGVTAAATRAGPLARGPRPRAAGPSCRDRHRESHTADPQLHPQSRATRLAPPPP